MLKKLMALCIPVMCICTILSLTAFAKTEQNIIDGTSAHTSNFSEIGVGMENTNEQPGALTIKTGAAEDAAGKQPEVTYSFNVSSDGIYILSLEASQHSYPMYFSPYSISVNGGEYININQDNAGASDNAAGKLDDNIYRYDTTLAFELDGGINTVTFRLDSVRNADGRAYAFLRKIIFTSLFMTDTMNVFEEGDEIELSGGASAVSYTVTDYNGETVSSGTSVNSGGEWVIRPGSLPIGHYMIKTAGAKEYFSVVKRYADRRSTDKSPFAADCASTFLVGDDKADSFAETIRLAGIPYIRDRIRWGEISPVYGTYNFDKYDNYVDAFAKRGIKITETFHSAPSYAVSSGAVLPDKLLYAYSFAKAVGTHFDGRVQSWEIWNEPDISFTGSDETADRYASVLKAMSLGFRDGGGALVSTAGFANVPGEYNDLFFSNDINSFFDIYNQHTHRNQDASKTIWQYPLNINAHKAFAEAYSAYDKPVWTGEAGVFMDVDDSENLSWEQQKKSARYLVTSSVEGLANGEDKHFWFIMPYYTEKGMSLGSFSSRGTPYASYSAAAAITESLGNGRYCGTIPIDGADAYCFKDGGEYVAVIWSGEERTISLAADGTDAEITDIVGNSGTQSINNGVLQINIGPDPIYVRADGFETLEEINSVQKKEKSKAPSAAERIVIVQKYPSSVSKNAKTDGYCLPSNGRTAVTAEIYNFNSTPVTVNLSVSAYGGWIIENGNKNITVPAMDSQSFTFYISSNGEPSGDAKYPVVINGTSEYGRLCRSVTYITVQDTAPPVIKEQIGGFNIPSNWVNSMPYGTKCIATAKNGGINFEIQFNESTGDKWCYPQLDFSGVQDYSTYNGIAVTVNADAAAAGSTFRLFLVENSGAMYFTSVGYVLSEGEQTIKIPWSRFVWQGGTNDTALDADSIKAVKAGVNAYTTEIMNINISSMGVYGTDIHMQGSIENIDTDGENITAELGGSVVPYTQNGAAVIIDGKEYPLELEGSVVKGTVKAPAGTHDALLRIYNESGRAVRSYFRITTEGDLTVTADSFSQTGGMLEYISVIENTAAEDKSLTFYFALYGGNGEQKNIYKKAYTLNAGERQDVSFSCDADGIAAIRVFTWYGGTMVPFRTPVEYKR